MAFRDSHLSCRDLRRNGKRYMDPPQPPNKMFKQDLTPEHLHSLPPEILSKILSLLFVNDRLNASLVCKRWHCLLNQPSMLNDICLEIEGYIDFLDCRHNVRGECRYFSRSFCNFQFCWSRLSEKFLMFMKDYRSKIKSLTFENCKWNIYSLQGQIKIICPNLEILKFENCPAGFERNFMNAFSLPALKSLSISEKHSDRTISNEDVTIMDSTMPKLESLELCLEHPYDHDQSDLRLANSLADFIRKRSTTLNDINIENDPKIKRLVFDKIIYFENFELSSFSENGCYKELDKLIQLKFFRRNLTNLVKLELCTRYWRTDVMKEICELMPNLKILNISGEIKPSIINVFKLKSLQHLTIIPHLKVEDDIFNDILNIFQLSRLKEFELRATQIREVTLIKLLHKMPALRSLKLHEKHLTNRTLKFVSKHLIYLRVLALVSNRISYNDISFITNIKGLRSLELHGFGYNYSPLFEHIAFLELHSFTFYDYTSKHRRNKNIWEKRFKENLQKHNPSLKNFYFHWVYAGSGREY